MLCLLAGAWQAGHILDACGDTERCTGAAARRPSRPARWGTAANLEELAPAGLAAVEVAGGAPEGDGVLCPAARARQACGKGAAMSTWQLVRPHGQHCLRPLS